MGEELIEVGVAPETALDILEAAKGHAEQLATGCYVDVFLKEVWEPSSTRPGAWPIAGSEVRESASSACVRSRCRA